MGFVLRILLRNYVLSSIANEYKSVTFLSFYIVFRIGIQLAVGRDYIIIYTYYMGLLFVNARTFVVCAIELELETKLLCDIRKHLYFTPFAVPFADSRQLSSTE